MLAAQISCSMDREAGLHLGFLVKGVFQCNRTLLGPSTFVLVSWCVDCF